MGSRSPSPNRRGRRRTSLSWRPLRLERLEERSLLAANLVADLPRWATRTRTALHRPAEGPTSWPRTGPPVKNSGKPMELKPEPCGSRISIAASTVRTRDI